MSKKPVPSKQTKETGCEVSTQSVRIEQAMSNAEITSLIEAKISESLSKHEAQLQLETTKLTSQQLQDVNAKLQQLSEGLQSLNRDQTQRIENVEKVLGSLQLSNDQLERNLKQKIDQVVEEKVRWIQQKVQLNVGKENYVKQEKCSEQLVKGDDVLQEELLKLHQQHHQDMLSVINDCCRKLKSGFTRQNKPYDVSEIHAVIDDIEQKMVREILSEIQKTNAHEDLSSFEEALESVKHSRELGEVKDNEVKAETTLTTEDISAALETFESEAFDKWSEELKPTKNAGGGELFEGPQEPIVEETISRSQGMITGDRGNLYYTEELKKTVDEIMSVTSNVETKKDSEIKKDSEDLNSDQSTLAKNYQEIEASLESMIVSDDTSDDFQPQTKTDNITDLKSLDEAIASDISGLESLAENFKSDLKSFDALIAADNFGDQFSTDEFTRDLLSLDAKIAGDSDKKEVHSSSSSKDDDQQLKSLEAKIATDVKGPTGGEDQLRSLEGKLESEIGKEAPGEAKGDANVKQTSPTKEQVQASQPQSASEKPEKQTAKETPAPVTGQGKTATAGEKDYNEEMNRSDVSDKKP